MPPLFIPAALVPQYTDLSMNDPVHVPDVLMAGVVPLVMLPPETRVDVHAVMRRASNDPA